MILASLPPQNTPANLFNPKPIEYRIGVSCDADEELYTVWNTFNCITANAMTSLKMAIKNRISELDNLVDNWDGYNAVAPSSIVIKNSYKFIDCILAEGFNSLKPEDVVPTPYGSVVMDFNTDKGLVSVEVGTSQIGFFTEFVKKQNFSSDGIDTDFRNIPESLQQALEFLYEE